MTQTWTGRSWPWLVPLVTFFTVVAMAVFLWFAFAWLGPDNFRAGKAATGLLVTRVLAVLLCLGAVWVLRLIVQANAPTTVTLTEDELTVAHGRSAHSIRLADVDTAMYFKTTVQSSSGLWIYPREEYLARINSRIPYGDADPDLTISGQRFDDKDEYALVRAVREAVKAAGGRFGTSVGAAIDPDVVEATAAARARAAAPRLPHLRFTNPDDA